MIEQFFLCTMYPFMGKIISQGKKMLGSKREPQRLGTDGTAVQTI